MSTNHSLINDIQLENYRAVLDAGQDFEIYYRWVLQSIRRFYINWKA